MRAVELATMTAQNNDVLVVAFIVENHVERLVDRVEGRSGHACISQTGFRGH